MARLSAIERGKKLLAGIQNFGGKLGLFALEILRPLGKGLKVAFDWLWDQGEKIYGSLEKRFAPVLRRWRGSVEAWWERRGWSPSLLRLLGNTLLALPIDTGWYLLYYTSNCIFAFLFNDPDQIGIPSQHLLDCFRQVIRLNPLYLLAWLVFAGSVRAWWFFCKEILPDRRKTARGGSAENGTPIEGGC